MRKFDRAIKRYFIHPDDQAGWIPFAYRHALTLARKMKFQAIYSTSAPISSHLIAQMVKKKTGLPWVADFRK